MVGYVSFLEGTYINPVNYPNIRTVNAQTLKSLGMCQNCVLNNCTQNRYTTATILSLIFVFVLTSQKRDQAGTLCQWKGEQKTCFFMQQGYLWVL